MSKDADICSKDSLNFDDIFIRRGQMYEIS